MHTDVAQKLTIAIDHNLKLQAEIKRLKVELLDMSGRANEISNIARDEVDRLNYDLNNSKNFHCPHFLTNDSGTISCDLVRKRLKAELDQQRFNNEHNLSIDQAVSDEIESLRAINTEMQACLEFEYRVSAFFDNDHRVLSHHHRIGQCLDRIKQIIEVKNENN
jgi:hypothetical protein